MALKITALVRLDCSKPVCPHATVIDLERDEQQGKRDDICELEFTGF
jgi:hypothetical protein